jgi:hypothetical protein
LNHGASCIYVNIYIHGQFGAKRAKEGNFVLVLPGAHDPARG